MSNYNNKYKQKTNLIYFSSLVIRVSFVVMMILMLSHCSNRKAEVDQVEANQVDIDETIRDPAKNNDSLIQVKPLVPAVVMTLIQQADEQLSKGKVTDAILTLKRALSIRGQIRVHCVNVREEPKHWQRSCWTKLKFKPRHWIQ